MTLSKLQSEAVKQNKDREELRKQIESLVTLYFGEPCIAVEDSLVDWIETHTQKKVEEEHQKLLDILEHNQDPMTGLYDYDGIAQEVIDLVKK